MSSRLNKSGRDAYTPAFPENTLCEVHRKLYWLLNNRPEQTAEMIELVKEAFVMGKKQ